MLKAVSDILSYFQNTFYYQRDILELRDKVDLIFLEHRDHEFNDRERAVLTFLSDYFNYYILGERPSEHKMNLLAKAGLVWEVKRRVDTSILYEISDEMKPILIGHLNAMLDSGFEPYIDLACGTIVKHYESGNSLEITEEQYLKCDFLYINMPPIYLERYCSGRIDFEGFSCSINYFTKDNLQHLLTLFENIRDGIRITEKPAAGIKISECVTLYVGYQAHNSFLSLHINNITVFHTFLEYDNGSIGYAAMNSIKDIIQSIEWSRDFDAELKDPYQGVPLFIGDLSSYLAANADK